MRATFNLTDATAKFGFNNGDNTNRDITTRSNATSNYLTTLTSEFNSVTTTSPFTIPTPTGRYELELPRAIPANSLIQELYIVFKEEVDMGVGGRMSIGIKNENFRSYICNPRSVADDGGTVLAGAVQGFYSIPSVSGGAAFEFAVSQRINQEYFYPTETNVFVEPNITVNDLVSSVDCVLVAKFAIIQ